jgi:hypothetical protein
MSSDDLLIEGASVHVYKHMGLVNSADKNAGYSTSIPTNPDGTYSWVCIHIVYVLNLEKTCNRRDIPSS